MYREIAESILSHAVYIDTMPSRKMVKLYCYDEEREHSAYATIIINWPVWGDNFDNIVARDFVQLDPPAGSSDGYRCWGRKLWVSADTQR